MRLSVANMRARNTANTARQHSRASIINLDPIEFKIARKCHFSGHFDPSDETGQWCAKCARNSCSAGFRGSVPSKKTHPRCVHMRSSLSGARQNADIVTSTPILPNHFSIFRPFWPFLSLLNRHDPSAPNMRVTLQARATTGCIPRKEL